jgi:hypothetical protein
MNMIDSLDACRCATIANSPAIPTLAIGAKPVKCRGCHVRDIWDVFSSQILPLLTSLKTPVRIEKAIESGKYEEELAAISRECFNWVQKYVAYFGLCVTPYVHIIGMHMSKMLKSSYNSIGEWSQVSGRRVDISSAHHDSYVYL